MFRDFLAYRNTRNPQLTSPPVIALHQHSHCVAPVLRFEHTRRRANAALKLITDHSRAPADIAFLYRAPAGLIQRVDGIFRLNMESIHVAPVAIPGLGHYG